MSELKIDYSKFAHYEATAIHGGPRFMHEKFCIVSDRPEFVKKDEQNRPHCLTGPHMRWRDGAEIYTERGTKVPASWINDPSSLDPKTALTWTNVEQRRVAAEIIGWKRVLESVSARVVDEDIDSSIGTLLEADLPDAPGSKFLRVRCGTGRTFVLPVPNEMRTALQANAWTYDFDDLEKFRNYAART